MNTQELHIAFKVEMDKTDSLSYPSFLPEEIDFWLNKAYIMLINQKFTGNNYSREDIDDSTKRLDDFKGLIKEYNISAVYDDTNVSSNCVYADLTEITDYLYYLSSKSTIHYSVAPNEVVPNVLIPAGDRNKYIVSRNNNPWIEYPVCYLEYGSDRQVIHVLYDLSDATSNSWSITELSIQYIKYPTVLNIISAPTYSPEISEHCHQELVSLAVNMAIENIESQRVQTNERNLAKLE